MRLLTKWLTGTVFPSPFQGEDRGEGNHSHLRWPVPLTLTLSPEGRGDCLCCSQHWHWTEPILTRQNVHYPRILLASRATLSISSNSSSSSGSKSSSLVPLRSCCSDQLAEILHTRHTAIAATAMQFMNQINQAFRVFSNQLFLNFVANFRQEIE